MPELAVLYKTALTILPRRDAKHSLKAAGEMTLIKKSGRDRNLGDRSRCTQSLLGFEQSDLPLIAMGRQAQLLMKASNQIVGAEIAEPTQGFDRDILGVMFL